MCVTRLRRFLLLFSISFVLSVHSFCYAETVLTDEETKQILQEIENSKILLKQAKEDLTQSKQQLQTVENELELQKQELMNVQNIYQEQKTFYEEQITEAEKKNKTLKTATVITSTSTSVLLVVLLVVILL